MKNVYFYKEKKKKKISDHTMNMMMVVWVMS